MKYYIVRREHNRFQTLLNALSENAEEMLTLGLDHGDFDTAEIICCTTDRETAEKAFAAEHSTFDRFDNYAGKGKTILEFDIVEFSEEEIDLDDFTAEEIESGKIWGDIIDSRYAPLEI